MNQRDYIRYEKMFVFVYDFQTRRCYLRKLVREVMTENPEVTVDDLRNFANGLAERGYLTLGKQVNKELDDRILQTSLDFPYDNP